MASASVCEVLERMRRALLSRRGSDGRGAGPAGRLENASRCMCLIKGDAETFWHIRKRGVLHAPPRGPAGREDGEGHLVCAVADELHLSEVRFWRPGRRRASPARAHSRLARAWFGFAAGASSAAN